MRRLTEIRDVVTNLVASETSRGSLEDEVNKSVASTLSAGGGPGAAGARQGAVAEPRRGPTGRAGAREPGQERDKGADMPAPPAPPPAPGPGPGHADQLPSGGRDHPGDGRDTRSGTAASRAQPGPDNGSTEAPGGVGENVRMLPE